MAAACRNRRQTGILADLPHCPSCFSDGLQYGRPSEKHNTGANAAATVETAKYQPFAYTSAFKASYRPSENLPLPQQIFRMQSFQL
jgi:hypothetical protein